MGGRVTGWGPDRPDATTGSPTGPKQRPGVAQSLLGAAGPSPGMARFCFFLLLTGEFEMAKSLSDFSSTFLGLSSLVDLGLGFFFYGLR